MIAFSKSLGTLMRGRNGSVDKYLLAALGITLFVFVIFLLILHNKTQEELRVAKETEFVEEMRRRSEGLAFFFSDRRNDLDDLAVSPSLEAYFLNKDLGVSLQYGLGANLDEIDRIMARLVDGRRFGGKAEPIYERMVMVDDAGVLLVDVASGGNASSLRRFSAQDLEGFLVKEETKAVVRFDSCASDLPTIVVLRPLFHKGRFVGQLIAWLRWESIREHRLSVVRRQATVAIYDDQGCACPNAPPPEHRASLAGHNAGMRDGGVVASEDHSGARMITVSIPVAATSLRFVASIPPAALFSGNTSAWLIGGLYGLAFLLFVSGAVIWRNSLRRDRLERDLRDAQKLEAVGQLAGGIAHEINTPSQYIGNNLTFLADAHAALFALLRGCLALIDDLKKTGTFADRLQEIDHLRRQADLDFLAEEIPLATEQSIFGIKQISRIVLAMKEFSHPGAQGKMPTDLNRAIENTVTISRNEWKHVAEVDTDFDPALPAVICLPGEITQVLLNLLVNAAHAVQAAGHDSSTGRIRVATAVEGDSAVIRVEDNGTGIPDAIRAKIFNPFFTTKEVGKGTGQGLPIARDIIVTKHGGSIRCESRTGKGTTFIVHLPIRGAVKTRNPDPKASKNGAAPRELI